VAGPLYGRNELVAAVARSEAALTLLTGDSGIGKSAILEAAAATPSAGWLNSSPSRLAASAGAVQQGVLEALADLIAQVVSERGSFEEIGDHLVGASERFVKENVKQLSKVVGAELLELVRSRLGPNFGQAVGRYISSLREEMDQTLAARLAAVADESTAGVLSAFAAEVVTNAGERRIGLYFDVGERLSDSEVRILADLADGVPSRCHVRVAFIVDNSHAADRIAELLALATNAFEISVEPLPTRSVEAWLTDTETDVELGAAMRATGGYPLLIGDLIRDLAMGGSIEDLPLNQQVTQRTERSWRALSDEASVVARKLCVLEDPLPEARLREIVGLDTATFGHVVAQLEYARLFPIRVAGQPWFHEQRRAFVLGRLTPAELDEASSKAASATWHELEASYDQKLVTQFARLATAATTLRSEDQRLDAVLNASDDELAVLSALVELLTPESNGATKGDTLFRHARQFTSSALIPRATLAALQEVNLVATASNEHTTIVVPILSPQAIAAVQGAAYDRLVRAPVPELSVLVFDLGLRPRLGPFTQARVGIGRPSVGGMARMASGGDAEAGFGARSPNRHDPAPHVLVRARYAERPMWLVASYENVETRDEASRGLIGLSTEIFGEPLSVERVFSQPLQVLPASHFVNSALRAARVTAHDPRGDNLRVELTQTLSHETRLALRVATAKQVRDLSSDLERHAMILEDTFAIYWDEQERARIECTVRGAGEEAIRVENLASAAEDSQYFAFDLEQMLGLQPNASITRVARHWGEASSDDPIFTELADLRSKMRAFNSAQPRKGFVLAHRALEEALRDGFLRQLNDARALLELVSQTREVQPIPPTALYVHVLLEAPTPGWVAGAGSDVIGIERESDSGTDDVHVAVTQGGVDVSGLFPRATGDGRALFREAFGFSPDREVGDFLSGLHTDVEGFLNAYCGFHSDDLHVRWPEEL
jgi:hypothetical protein